MVKRQKRGVLPGDLKPAGRLVLILSCLFAWVPVGKYQGAVFAQDWHQTYWKNRLNHAEATELISGRTLRYPGLGQSTFYKNGALKFTPETEESTRFGFFEVRPDGRVCVNLYGQESQCNVFIQNQGFVFMLNDQGQRFPVFFVIEGR